MPAFELYDVEFSDEHADIDLGGILQAYKSEVNDVDSMMFQTGVVRVF